ncbi:MAG TPA: hypothetical protein VLA11_06380 [Woeseiaceae bacterium]|jgi:hypothetical protein|nr:hypothetical protein [Woeseiaceae bacterium]
MRSLAIALLAMGLASATFADEMTVAEKIESAMSAAPARISANATIAEFDGTVLREGSNQWTCLPGGPSGSKRYPMCHDPVFMKWSNTVWDGKAFSTDVIGYSYMLAGGYAADINDPLADKSDEGNNWHHEGPHMMLIMPGADLREGLSADPDENDIFVLWKDTPMELVIIPLGDVITE